MPLNLTHFKAFLLLSLLLLIPLSSGANFEGYKEATIPYHFYHKAGFQAKTRKLMMDMLDYDDTGANPKHDPRRRSPGGGRIP